MSAMYPYLLVYLAGFATPILILQSLVKDREDGSSCLLNFILGIIVLLALVVLYFWITTA